MRRVLFAYALAAVCLAAERKPVSPADVKPVGPYSPGILAGSYLYVSGQGAQKPGGGFHSSTGRQTRQCLDNVKAVVEAAGLTMQHIVYTQVYLTDMTKYAEMAAAYASYFPHDPPARAVIGVARMPLDTPVEISAVAVTDVAYKKLLRVRGLHPRAGVSPVVFAPRRTYISGVLGRYADTNQLPDEAVEQVRLAVDHFKLMLKQAHHKPEEVTVATVYINDNIPPEIAEEVLREELPKAVLVRTHSLPLRSNVEITGIVATDLEIQNARGTTEEILKSFSHLENAVVSNVYIDAIDNFASMNKTYASFFNGVFPTRTTVQPWPVDPKGRNQITILTLK